jgi:hypothetical protein
VSGAEAPRSPDVFFDLGEDTMPQIKTDADADPDHHLWRNGRLFWVAFTVHLPGWQKERIRRSLGTADVEEARRRRDQLLRDYPRQRQCELSLRLSSRPTRRFDSGNRRPEVAA